MTTEERRRERDGERGKEKTKTAERKVTELRGATKLKKGEKRRNEKETLISF